MASSAPPPESRAPDLHVLIIEDDPDLRSLMYLGLLLQGMTGDAVTSGMEGLRYARRTAYDVVICDVRLPGISGIEVTRRFRRRRKAPKVILVTAHATPELLERAAAAGASRVFSKPLRLRTLARAIHDVLSEQ